MLTGRAEVGLGVKGGPGEGFGLLQNGFGSDGEQFAARVGELMEGDGFVGAGGR